MRCVGGSRATAGCGGARWCSRRCSSSRAAAGRRSPPPRPLPRRPSSTSTSPPTTAVPQDAKLSAADFANINTMTRVGDHFVANVRGHLAQALAVARSAKGGVYPVGTIIQLIPQEAMVKRAKGFSPATKDWEFFSLDVSATGTKILSRGGAKVVNRFGGSCASCHSAAAAAVRLRVRHDPRLRTAADRPRGDRLTAESRPSPAPLNQLRARGTTEHAPNLTYRADLALSLQCPEPTRSRPCPPHCAEPPRRRARRAGPCSRRGARGSASCSDVEIGRGSRPESVATIATTRWPNCASGAPTTTASATAGCVFNTASTSSGYTFSPPVLMHIEPRPSRCTVPSASMVAMSPGSDQRPPSISTNVRSLRSGSL